MCQERHQGVAHNVQPGAASDHRAQHDLPWHRLHERRQKPHLRWQDVHGDTRLQGGGRRTRSSRGQPVLHEILSQTSNQTTENLVVAPNGSLDLGSGWDFNPWHPHSLLMSECLLASILLPLGSSFFWEFWYSWKVSWVGRTMPLTLFHLPGMLCLVERIGNAELDWRHSMHRIVD